MTDDSEFRPAIEPRATSASRWPQRVIAEHRVVVLERLQREVLRYAVLGSAAALLLGAASAAWFAIVELSWHPAVETIAVGLLMAFAIGVLYALRRKIEKFSDWLLSTPLRKRAAE